MVFTRANAELENQVMDFANSLWPEQGNTSTNQEKNSSVTKDRQPRGKSLQKERVQWLGGGGSKAYLPEVLRHNLPCPYVPYIIKKPEISVFKNLHKHQKLFNLPFQG